MGSYNYNVVKYKLAENGMFPSASSVSGKRRVWMLAFYFFLSLFLFAEGHSHPLAAPTEKIFWAYKMTCEVCPRQSYKSKRFGRK